MKVEYGDTHMYQAMQRIHQERYIIFQNQGHMTYPHCFIAHILTPYSLLLTPQFILFK
jgi:hypothetical protein